MNVPTLKELTTFTLDSYVNLLNYLKQKYTIVPFCKAPVKDSPYLILRHDIDASIESSLKMAQIEKDLNIQSTYFVLFSSSFYNVFEGNNIEVIKQISDLGHEIGFHYCPSQYTRYNQDPVKTLKLEIQMLEHLLNKKVYSIARHGPWDRDPFTGIKEYRNANHPDIRGDLFVHESDRTWTPLEGLVTLLNDHPKRVQLLVHAENWQEDKIDRVALLERHFGDLDKKNLLEKKKILDYFKTEQLVVEYDEQLKKNENGKSSTLGHTQIKKKNRFRQFICHYSNLFSYYLINTKLGWNLQKLSKQIHGSIPKLGALPIKEPELSKSASFSSRIKPLIVINAHYSSISGGYRRIYKILKNGKKQGIDYVIVTDSKSYNNYVTMFPGFKKAIHQYKSYIIRSPTVKTLNCLYSALAISKIVHKENVDLIVGSSEGFQHVWTSFLLGKLCKKPWTFIFAGQKDIFQPTPRLGSLNLSNIFNHVTQKQSQKHTSIFSKWALALGLLVYLKVAEKSLILTVSPSIAEELNFLNPRINFNVIVPGNGIDLKKYKKEPPTSPIYDGVFFSRLIPEKGLFDLPEITKLLMKRIPTVKIAVAGISQSPEFVETFQKMTTNYNLDKNIDFVGQLDEDSVIDLVKSSKLTIYPSVSDSYGLVVLESLACGKPVVAYDIPAIKHNFGHLKEVLRSPIANKVNMAKNIQFLLENANVRTNISKEAKDYVNMRDWSNVAKAEKEAYFKVIEWFNSRA